MPESSIAEANQKQDEKISCGRNFKAVTFSDSAEFKIENEDGSSKYCRGFHVNADGTLKLTGSDDKSEAVSIKVKEGNYYPYSVRLFWSTGTDAALKSAGATIAAR